MPPAIALVLVTHDSAAWLPPFAESWNAAWQLPSGLAGDVEISVADSGSLDVSCDLISKLFPEARLLNCGNIGFGAAANAAIGQTTAPWILLCNPDITFPPDLLRLLLDPLRNPPQMPPVWLSPNVACIAPRLLNPDGSAQPSVGRFPTLAGILRDQLRPRHLRKYTFPQPASAGPVDWATGACLLLQREAFAAVGGFDEKYFLYVEEVDLQRRLRLAGYTTVFAHEVTITHHAPSARRPPRPDAQRWAARGMLRYFAKYGDPFTLAAYRLLALANGRLPLREALAPRRTILTRATGP